MRELQTGRWKRKHGLSVRLLVARAGTGSTELLGLAAAGVGNEESAVISEEDVLDLLLGSLIDDWAGSVRGDTVKGHTLLVVGNESLGDGLADSWEVVRKTSKKKETCAPKIWET
jgi:hypothetical protein